MIDADLVVIGFGKGAMTLAATDQIPGAALLSYDSHEFAGCTARRKPSDRRMREASSAY